MEFSHQHRCNLIMRQADNHILWWWSVNFFVKPVALVLVHDITLQCLFEEGLVVYESFGNFRICVWGIT